MTAKPSKEEIKVEEKKPRKVKKSAEPKIEDEFHKTELPWMVRTNNFVMVMKMVYRGYIQLLKDFQSLYDKVMYCF